MQFSSVFIAICILQYFSPTAAITQFKDEPGSCHIIGDPDVYGLGIRISLYLQWIATLIAIFTADANRADMARTNSNIICAALYVNFFRNGANGSIVAVEWSLLWYMTFCLLLANFPFTKKGWARPRGSTLVMFLLWAIYYISWPWIFFQGHR